MNILELFAGIGGVAEAIRQSPAIGTIHQAVDIDQQAQQVYRHNFSWPTRIATIESPASWQNKIDWRVADTWWLSPPCQPYCRRGKQSPQDPRRAAFAQVMHALSTAGSDRPQRIAMENVPEFHGSADHRAWRALLDRLGYRCTEQFLCPTTWGIPNRRRRYYLTAWRSDSSDAPAPPMIHPPLNRRSLPKSLDLDAADDLWIDDGSLDAVSSALHIVDAEDETAVTACFTSGYGKSIKQAGSYLSVAGRLRRFSPTEIQRLLGFSDAFVWPQEVSQRRRWKLLGNSLSIVVVREILQSLVPGGIPTDCANGTYADSPGQRPGNREMTDRRPNGANDV